MLPRDLLRAEAAAHVLGDDAHVLRREPELLGHLVAHGEDALRRLVHGELVAVPERRAAVRLERVMQSRLRAVGGLEHDIRLPQAARDIATRFGLRLERLPHEIEGERLVLHVDEPRCVRGELVAVGGDGGHFVTDVAHRAIEEAARVMPGDARAVGAREHRVHAGKPLGARGVDMPDARMWIGTAHDVRMEQPGQAHVSGIARAPGHFVGAFQPRDHRSRAMRAARRRCW